MAIVPLGAIAFAIVFCLGEGSLFGDDSPRPSKAALGMLCGVLMFVGGNRVWDIALGEAK